MRQICGTVHWSRLQFGWLHLRFITPWKINGWNLQITHEKKGKWSSKPPWACSMLIFRGVVNRNGFFLQTGIPLSLLGPFSMHLSRKKQLAYSQVHCILPSKWLILGGGVQKLMNRTSFQKVRVVQCFSFVFLPQFNSWGLQKEKDRLPNIHFWWAVLVLGWISISLEFLFQISIQVVVLIPTFFFIFPVNVGKMFTHFHVRLFFTWAVKKNLWLFTVYSGLYYPVVWGL